MARTLISAPASDPVTLAEAKEHLRVDEADQDTLITTLISAATKAVEHGMNRDLVTRTWRLDLACFKTELFLGPVPLNSVTSVEYYDADDVDQTVNAADYRISIPDAMLYFDDDYSFPSIATRHDAVRITYVSGYDTADIPAQAKAAILLVLGDMYENREGQVLGLNVNENQTVSRLLDSLRATPQCVADC